MLIVGRQKMKRRNVGAVILVVGVVALWASPYAQTADDSIPFDATVWAQGENAKFSTIAPRLRMADGLIKSRVLLGKSRSEVKAMLGVPTQTNKFRDYDLVYWLGAERGYMSIDSEWLAVRFGDTGNVIEASIVRD